ncbi:hypothetical protein KIV66_gp35 [Mycobacterium phage MyraDee]|uniref:Uncharacterized protein n=1 Tax=Mycobacterium phage MyraDee TaxID=2024303 RepID=A0A222YYZ8_9CAUD|nr:hypothetical protein KIV66_gp35 [Mycobacterium phage MyraDee]ASR77143.1 hypothetical protein SEA_MYRADEE_35 [Mycobacterium phage MyraDee]
MKKLLQWLRTGHWPKRTRPPENVHVAADPLWRRDGDTVTLLFIDGGSITYTSNRREHG